MEDLVKVSDEVAKWLFLRGYFSPFKDKNAKFNMVCNDKVLFHNTTETRVRPSYYEVMLWLFRKARVTIRFSEEYGTYIAERCGIVLYVINEANGIEDPEQCLIKSIEFMSNEFLDLYEFFHQ